MMIMDPESGPPNRCDSTLSVIKIQPATRPKRGNFPLVTQKFSDPEIEELYQLHSTNRKRTELFRCFLYAVLFYCIANIIVHSFWVCVYRHHHHDQDSFDIDNEAHSTFFQSGPGLGPHAEHHNHHQETNYGQNDKGHEPSPHHHHHQHHPEQNVQHYRNSTYKSHPIHPMSGFGGTHNSNHGTSPILNSTHHQPNFQPIYVNNKFEGFEGTPEKTSSNTNDGIVLSENQRPGKHPYFHASRNYNPQQTSNPHNSTNYSSFKSTARRRSVVPSSSATITTVEVEVPLSPLVDWRARQSTKYNYDANDNNVFIVCTLVILSITTIIVLLILLPIGFCQRNPHIPVILWSLSILLPIALRSDPSIPLRTGLGWIILETFLIWVTLPIRLRTATFYSILLTLSHSAIVIWRGIGQPMLGNQLGANLILLLSTNILGLLSFYLSDKKQRRAFIDTRQSLEMKLVIEEQAKEQERLLLSVLPEHLALKMRQDLGAAVDGQFKKIYMSRHENVSILYADIVGFTAISSTYSASELVKILNELFARFDRLADKYHQIRIKILGDCYYCICGAPEERPDHGVLCVHMGLSMVKAIKYVRETTNSPVDMRVGIHTGAILAGVLGQKQWQFDIYSKDVELANKMESSGMPGRVHVSEKTLSFLNDEFEVEPGHGEKREEILRIAGIKTYFISKVKKPFRASTASVTENGEIQPEDLVSKDFPSELNSTYAEDSNSNVEENQGPRRNQSELESYRQRLKEELISRDGYRDLSRQTKWFSLRFQDAAKESEFLVHKEPYAGITSLACPTALASFSLATFFVISFTFVGLLTATLGLLILLFISALSACESSPFKSRLKKVSSILTSLCSMESKLWVRRVLSIFAILLLTASNAVFTIPCLEAGSTCPNSTKVQDSSDGHVDPPLVLPTQQLAPFSSLGCLFPAYLVIFCAFFLLSVTLLSQPGSWLKSFAILVVLTAHAAIVNVSPLKDAVDCSEQYSFLGGRDLIPESWYLSIFTFVIFLVLFSLNRRLEKSSRVLFLWKTEVELQRERATQLRQKNEALVQCILPQHVATHFLGSRRRKHEELYSQSYSEVGILFASMPNFSDFYSEETVNNQGLECLRFLNEVISDFDALLELPRFADNIIKIKTISSTYMAASGLSPLKQTKPEDPLKIRWNHLSLLVEFAFELKRALTSINEQSFNHFVLKMGINHGPITAGVIGARKPHYDIWGNSVNVASRMESTGKAGCIQVTDETYRILLIYGYQFEQRGLVNVKGKGQLMTYYLVGRGPELTDDQVQKVLEEQAALEESSKSQQPLISATLESH